MNDPISLDHRRDAQTAHAFSTSWNNLPGGSVYTPAQFADWMAPLERVHLQGKRVLELGCGNGSLLCHAASWGPAQLVGVDLGDSVQSARENVRRAGFDNVEVRQDDLTTFEDGGFDVVYCIGVLHHLKQPLVGFRSVVRNTRPGGKFHCWVYAKEGNGIVRALVEPVRRIACKLPWWANKYLVATPLVAPYYFYAKALRLLAAVGINRALSWLPLHEYSLWIAEREFSFFRHVAFDQLVTPQTVFVSKEEVEAWLRADPRILPDSTYVIRRNGNSWKFGGRVG